MIRRGYQIPTNDSKIYEQFLSLLNFSLKATPQEREVLAEIIRLNNEYEALPPKQRAKFILSTDMRKEVREKLEIEEKQFNTVLSRVKKKKIFGKPVFDEDGVLNPVLIVKPDNDGLQVVVNLVNTVSKPKEEPIPEEEPEKEAEEIVEEAKPKKEEPRKLAKDANGTDNIIQDNVPSGFVILPPND
jgi:hypothetical protein